MADQREHPEDDPRVDTVSTEDRREVVGRERDEHGGVKIGSAFFGWVTAMGMVVLLTGLLVITATLLPLENLFVDGRLRLGGPDLTPADVGLVGVVVGLVILFLAYFSGGYVAGRMARFDGAKQGVAVWAWAVIVGLVVAGLGAVADTDYGGFEALPRLATERTASAVLSAALVLGVTLIGAVLGGLAGMRFHRRVDRTGLGR